MPAFRASGRSGHALTTAARSGLSSGAGATTQTRVARRLREGPGTARLGHDEEIERSGFDVARIPEISGLSGLGRSDSEYRRWESNPHGRFRPEESKSSLRGVCGRFLGSWQAAPVALLAAPWSILASFLLIVVLDNIWCELQLMLVLKKQAPPSVLRSATQSHSMPISRRLLTENRSSK